MELKEIRKKNKLTQQECADMFGISRRSYQAIENKENGDETEKYDYYYSLLESNLEKKEQPVVKYSTSVTLGEDLIKMRDKVYYFHQRYCYSHLVDYLRNDYGPRVCILYGLRRTGKTTLLAQLISAVPVDETAYIKLNESNTMGDLIDDINRLKEKGIKYLFIDEVTLVSDFINASATLSDIYCAIGMKIILSGADSLGFAFAKNDELYDRSVTVHTSYISYKEFCYLLGNKNIDEYIEYGGTLRAENMKLNDPDFEKVSVSFSDDESTRKYIDTAIAKNIQRSLSNNKFGSRFNSLKELYDKDELTNVINRVVQDMNHQFLLNVVTKKFKSNDLGSARQLLTKSKLTKIQTALYSIDEEKVIGALKHIISVKENAELKVPITEDAIKQIQLYLQELDLIKEVEVRYSNGRKEKRQVFTQPGMRYSIAKALVYSLTNDAYIQSLTIQEQDFIIKKILSDVKGRMLEDIILYEATRKKTEDELVFKYIDDMGGEYDMVIYNYKENSYALYEIKHSSVVSFDNQTKYLNDKKMFERLSRGDGVLKSKNVLYTGDIQKVKDVNYMDASRYLKG